MTDRQPREGRAVHHLLTALDELGEIAPADEHASARHLIQCALEILQIRTTGDAVESALVALGWARSAVVAATYHARAQADIARATPHPRHPTYTAERTCR